MPELMTTREVADYLRIKERKVYDLVRAGKIPCSRVTGKWLFPKDLIDLWVARSTELPDGLAAAPAPAPPPIVAGSHDPLLEWALREAGSDLAFHAGGSLDGLRRLARGEALLAGSHAPDPEGGYSGALYAEALAGAPVVAIEWARRRQGLVLAAGNPRHIESVAQLADPGITTAIRQEEAGSRLLLLHLLDRAGLSLDDLEVLEPPARSESDLAAAISDGRADAGVAIEAAAVQHRLAFVPLVTERYDLVMMQRDYFGPSVQALLRFGATGAFQDKAQSLGGYETGGLGTVVFSGP